MTKVRDRYQSGFDGDVPGPRAAVYDIGLALWLLEEFSQERGLLNERVTLSDGRYSWSIADLLRIARRALDTSVSDAIGVYQRLQENANAVETMLQDTHERQWVSAANALRHTLENQAIVKRSDVTKARRRLQRAAKRMAAGEVS